MGGVRYISTINIHKSSLCHQVTSMIFTDVLLVDIPNRTQFFAPVPTGAAHEGRLFQQLSDLQVQQLHLQQLQHRKEQETQLKLAGEHRCTMCCDIYIYILDRY